MTRLNVMLDGILRKHPTRDYSKCMYEVHRSMSDYASDLMEELLFMLTALGLIAVTNEATPQGVVTDNLLLAWCLGGSVGAAVIAVYWWGAEETKRKQLGIFISNVFFGTLFGPSACGWLAGGTEGSKWALPLNMRNALFVSGFLSLVAYFFVRPLATALGENLRKWLSTMDIGLFIMRLFNIQPIQTTPPPAVILSTSQNVQPTQPMTAVTTMIDGPPVEPAKPLSLGGFVPPRKNT